MAEMGSLFDMRASARRIGRRASSGARIGAGPPRSARSISAVAIGATVVVLSASITYAAESPPRALEAHVLSVQDSSKLHLVKAVGNVLTEEGRVTGTLPGTAKISIDLHEGGGTATARFSLYVAGSSINAHASGRGHEGHGGWESFSGTMALTGGTGRYEHASGSGHMYGALNRRNDELVVQTSVRMRY